MSTYSVVEEVIWQKKMEFWHSVDDRQFYKLLLMLIVFTRQQSKVTRPDFVNHLELLLVVSNGGRCC